MQFSQRLFVFKELLLTDLMVLRKVILDKLINLSIWVFCTQFVMTYFLQQADGDAFGVFMMASICATAGFFEIYPAAVSIVADLNGDKKLFYELTLPLSSRLVLVRLAVYYMINAFIMGIWAFPLSLTFVYSSLSFASISWFKLGIAFICISIFYGVFTLWLASFIKDMSKLGSIWMRIVFPLWFLGGFQFSWEDLNKLSPFLGKMVLLNPIIYAMEGMRSLFVAREALPFVGCMIALIIFSILFLWHALVRWKKRLDYV